MPELTRNRLAVRQASYAVAVIVVIASLISLVEIIQLYADEQERLTKTLSQQINMASSAASRSAFHVDEIQAATTLEGLFQFDNLEWARITTDQGQVLAEQRRPVRVAFTDPLARYLFTDFVLDQRNLIFEQASESGSSDQPENAQKIIGVIELRASPELAGERFFESIVTLVAALLFQSVLLGLTLTVVFHRSLTLPILAYAEAISKLVTTPARLTRLATPRGHEHDEFGMVVAQTNQLLKKLESQHLDLLHREKIATLGTLLAGVSHELNNPLSILAVQSELLVETAPDDATRERGHKILAMTKRCAAIVQRFLALARRREVRKEPTNVGAIIHEVLEILDYQLMQAGVEVNVEISENLPLVMMDKSQITQSFLNLIVNAQHALSEIEIDRRITIEAESLEKDSSVQISITDNGPGVQTEAREHVFEPFYTTKREGQGTGLGLSYAREVARDHGGDLTTTTSSPRGATFTLTLPSSMEGELEE